MNFSGVPRIPRRIAPLLASTAKHLSALWIFGLIRFSGPFPDDSVFNTLLAILWFAALWGVSFRIRHRRLRRAPIICLFLIPLLHYQFLRPSNHRDWEAPHGRTAYAIPKPTGIRGTETFPTASAGGFRASIENRFQKKEATLADRLFKPK